MENKTDKLCRICFDVGHFSLSGYEISIQGKNLSIEDMIKRFSGIEFTEHAPDLICENCTHDLVQSYLFSEKVLESDAKILNLAQLKEENFVVYDELISEKDDEEEFLKPNIVNEFYAQNIEEQNSASHNIEDIEDDIVSEEDHCDLVEESPEVNEDEIYSESEISANELEKLSSEDTVIQFDPTEDDQNIVFDNDLFEEDKELLEPRRKYQKRIKTENEVDKNGSFVITQFASSTTAPGKLINIHAEDTDEVSISDVRIMNYETVEVKAGNIGVMTQTPQSELPIDDSRVYLCQYCPRAFSSSAFLVTHVRKTHGCNFCACIFEKAKDLYQHIRESHTKFECVVCGKEFTSNSNMRNHLKNVHKVKVPANVSLISYKKQCEPLADL